MSEPGPRPRPGPSAVVLAVGLVALFGLGAWFRVTSLATAPLVIGDEACVGTQGVRLLRGEPATLIAPTGNIINPFLILMQLPLHALLPPSDLSLRAPAALSGLLAVWLAYALGRRALDRTTAAIAAGTLAALPVAVIFSRIGWESCQVPLFGVLALDAALRGRRLGLLLAFLASYLAHPTSLFLAPLLLGLLLLQMYKQYGDDRQALRRKLIGTTAAAVAVVGVMVAMKRRAARTQAIYTVYGFGEHDLGRFLGLFRKLLLGFCQGGPTESSPALAWAFWAVVLAALVPGLALLVRRRRRERAALVVGLVVTLFGFHAAVGVNALRPELARYGLFLVVPAAFAFACLVAELLAPSGPLRRLQLAGLVAGGLALVLSVKGNYLDHFAHFGGSRPERAWTLRTETDPPMPRIARLIRRDIDRSGGAGGRRVVLTEDWWSYRPIQYHETDRRDIKVASLEKVPPAGRDRIVREQLRAGGYAVSTRDREIDGAVRSAFRPEELRHWHISIGGIPLYVVYRLRSRPDEAQPRCDGPCAVVAGGAPAARSR